MSRPNDVQWEVALLLFLVLGLRGQLAEGVLEGFGCEVNCYLGWQDDLAARLRTPLSCCVSSFCSGDMPDQLSDSEAATMSKTRPTVIAMSSDLRSWLVGGSKEPKATPNFQRVLVQGGLSAKVDPAGEIAGCADLRHPPELNDPRLMMGFREF